MQLNLTVICKCIPEY